MKGKTVEDTISVQVEPVLDRAMLRYLFLCLSGLSSGIKEHGLLTDGKKNQVSASGELKGRAQGD
jgi:hypothetical protein